MVFRLGLVKQVLGIYKILAFTPKRLGAVGLWFSFGIYCPHGMKTVSRHHKSELRHPAQYVIRSRAIEVQPVASGYIELRIAL